LRETDLAHRKMLDVARVAGMVEVTSSFIHNIGNVLNSLNVDILCLEEAMDRINVEMCRRILDETKPVLPSSALPEGGIGDLAAPSGDPETIAKMTSLLLLLREQAKESVESMKKNMEHMVSIIHMQQDFSRTAEIVEPHRVNGLVEQAIEINCSTSSRIGSIRFVRDFQTDDEALIDKHRFLQILVNLLSNAVWAVMENRNEQERSIVVRTSARDGSYVRVEVIDNGIGISEDIQDRLFSQGFTTRPDGHGYGLHSAANMAWEMGGSLHAFSDGFGKGARFLLEIPIRQ
jgi:signal transduction histidine kinase